MPDLSLLQPLCDILDISLNEFFSGKHISIEEYKGKAEENISKLFKEKQIASLKPVKYLFAMCANATFYVSAIELVVGVVVYFFNKIMLEVMLWNISVWLLLFVISIGKLTYDKKKLKNLKNFGVCVEAKIVKLIPVSWVRIGNYNTCRVVCKYCLEGKDYKAVSDYYVLTPFLHIEDLCANVYVEKNNPAKYSVELLQTD